MALRLSVLTLGAGALFGLVSGAFLACSASGDPHTTGPHGGDGGILTGPSSSAASGLSPDAACGSVTENAKAIPLNLYITFDKSSSMAGNKWTSAKAGLSTFANDPTSAGVSAALNFFPLDNNPTCDQFAYEPPVVAFGPLPKNGAAIDQAMNATTPNGFSTPIYPALGGAILGAKDELDKNPGQAAAVLLVTDGQPQGPAPMCAGVDPEDPAEIAKLAAAGLMYGIPTFVIGLPGVDQTTANLIAKAGGTGTSILVGGGNVQMEFAAALAQVRGESVPCSYLLPDDVDNGKIDKGNVNVLVTPSGMMQSLLPQDPSCQGPGWKYDDPQNPKYIILCPDTCNALHADFGAKVQVLLGCKTETIN